MSCGARTSSCLVHTLSHNLPFELERYYQLLHGHGPSMGTQALSLLVFYLVLGFLASCLSSAHSLVADPWHPASSTSRLVTCLWLQHSPAHGRHEFYRQAVGGGAATLELSSALNVRCMRVRGPFSSTTCTLEALFLLWTLHVRGLFSSLNMHVRGLFSPKILCHLSNWLKSNL